MLRRRYTLEDRDRESGLAFSWRVPLSSLRSLILAFLLVGLAALALSAFVRVGMGGSRSEQVRLATIVMVPMDRGGARIDREAREAGPFPVRWNPAADLNYSALRNRALRKAADVEVPYLPRIAPVELEEHRGVGEVSGRQATLPPLPERTLTAEEKPSAREVGHGLRILRGSGGLRLLHAGLFLPAEESPGVVGVRYLIEFDRDGRVLEVTRLDSGDPEASIVAWVARARVEGHQGEPGWLVVESVIGS